jgi:hypothetical protein
MQAYMAVSRIELMRYRKMEYAALSWRDGETPQSLCRASSAQSTRLAIIKAGAKGRRAVLPLSSRQVAGKGEEND